MAARPGSSVPLAVTHTVWCTSLNPGQRLDPSTACGGDSTTNRPPDPA